MADLSGYFKNRTHQPNRAIARRIEADPSTINRQLTGVTSVTVETVVAICRAYGLDLADAFVAAGFITHDEAGSFGDAQALRRVADLELAREIVRRLEAGEATEALTEPIDVDPAAGGVVKQFPQKNAVGGSEEALPEAAWESDVDHTQDTGDYTA